MVNALLTRKKYWKRLKISIHHSFLKKTTQDQNLDTLFKEKYVRKLSLSESKILEGELTLDEISLALKQMKNNKCPGVDGFSAEFFKNILGTY